MGYFFSSESVSEGHPDKVADQISDAILDNFLSQDPDSKVAVETLVTTGQVILAGEVNSNAYVDLQRVTRDVIRRIGYNKSEYQFDADSCGVLSAIHEQSPDINQGVVRTNPMEQGAGDQGMMFGYAVNDTDNLMPLSLDLSHALVRELAAIRKEGKVMTYLRPDAKSQVTIEYDNNHTPLRVDTILVSTQHDEFQGLSDEQTQQQIRQDILQYLIPRVKDLDPIYGKLINEQDPSFKLLVNPTGKFVIGGPHGDTGLTGRKIIVDTYGGKGAHGGGAFSGKDPSKVDRSAAYAARHIAKNLVAAGVTSEALVQIAYAIGVAQPLSVFVNTYGKSNVNLSDGQIANKVIELFDLRPKAIEQTLKLRNPIYEETAAYGHMGRKPQLISKFGKQVELFTWEKTNRVDDIRQAFNL